MKGLKRGPELKMPELKVPQVLKDLFDDLRDRRLLPLIALLIVATIAVPFLLGDSPDEAELAPAPALGAAAQASKLTAVKATPGLRDYRRRLRGRSATDPFLQRFSKPDLKGAKLQSQSSTSPGSGESQSASATTGGGSAGSEGATGAGETGAETEAGAGGGGGEPGAGGANTGGGETTSGVDVFTWTLKAQIAHTEVRPDGSTQMGKPEVRERVKTLSPLPSPKVPVVTFMGRSPQTGKAVFMVSRDVTAIFGEAKCIAGTETCELLEAEPGFPVVFEYGPEHVRYKITAIKVDLVKAGTVSADDSSSQR